MRRSVPAPLRIQLAKVIAFEARRSGAPQIHLRITTPPVKLEFGLNWDQSKRQLSSDAYFEFW